MLEQLRDALLADIASSAAQRKVTERIHVIYENSIEDEVRDSLRRDTAKDRKYAQLCSRIPDINLIRKVTDKIAKVYNKPALRKVKTGTVADQELVDYYSSVLALDAKMNTANKVLEWGRGCALEPYIDAKTGKPKLRVLAPYQVRAYSGDLDDPLSITAVTKIMGQITRIDPTTLKEFKTTLYHTYSDDEFMQWTDHTIDFVEPNPVGRIPIIWLNRSQFRLNSYAPESDINSAVLVPKSYADLYYAMAYSAHSIWAAIDLELPDKIDHDPGAVLDLKTAADSADQGKQGRLETVKPTLDISGSLELIKQTVFDMLESRGIKPPQTTASLERPNASAALIENADASSYIIQSCAFFHSIENELWDLIKHLHNKMWIFMDSNIELKKTFSPGFKLDIVFAEVKPVEIKGTQLDNIKKQRDMGLMSRKQAVSEIYPHYTEAQVEAWLAEAEKEAEDAAKAQLTEAPLGNAEGASGRGDNSQDSGSDPRGAGPGR